MASSKFVYLTRNDLDLLRAIARGERPPLSSSYRVRLEMMGLLRDSARGVFLTEEGERQAANGVAVDPPLEQPPRPSNRDSLGRKAAGERLVPF